jgi:hypothetical protein
MPRRVDRCQRRIRPAWFFNILFWHGFYSGMTRRSEALRAVCAAASPLSADEDFSAAPLFLPECRKFLLEGKNCG